MNILFSFNLSPYFIISCYLWIGGQTATNSLANCYKVQYSKEKALTLTSFPALPEPLDNFSGASVGSKVFVAGGNAFGKASNKVFYINTATDSLLFKQQ